MAHSRRGDPAPPARLIFVDAFGGALSSIAAAVARSLGRSDVVAATSTAVAAIPPEVTRALSEIGLAPAPVVHLDAKDREGESIQVVDETWGARLHPGPGDMERMSNARIARDRIERRIERILKKPG